LLKFILNINIILLLNCITTISLYASFYPNLYPINSPYRYKDVSQNTLFGHYSEQPKHFDPARSYSSDEYLFITQIYEPLYEYHYLIRPYKLIPLSATDYVTTEYFDKNNKKLTEQAISKDISYTIYTIKIKPNILYQPHPGFTKKQDQFVYHNLDNKFINNQIKISVHSHTNII